MDRIQLQLGHIVHAIADNASFQNALSNTDQQIPADFSSEMMNLYLIDSLIDALRPDSEMSDLLSSRQKLAAIPASLSAERAGKARKNALAITRRAKFKSLIASICEVTETACASLSEPSSELCSTDGLLDSCIQAESRTSYSALDTRIMQLGSLLRVFLDVGGVIPYFALHQHSLAIQQKPAYKSVQHHLKQ